MRKFLREFSKLSDPWLSVINGVFGDSLEKNSLRIAIKMKLCTQGKTLNITRQSLKKSKLLKNGKVCILAHGICDSEKGWNFKEDSAINYGSLLEKDKGFTPLFLRYNSGLHISTNGKRLSNLLEKFVLNYPEKISELVLVGHSMGGLLFRSACYYGEKGNKRWVKYVKKVFYLGSPHLGTHFELLGKLTTSLVNLIPNLVTKAIVSLGDLRSAGIKDLRHGYIIDEDWKNKNADDLFYWHENKAPLLKSAHHYLICGTLSKDTNSTWGRLIGDGMVHPASATGKSPFTSSPIPFLKEHSKIISETSHIELQKSMRVYEQIRIWCN